MEQYMVNRENTTNENLYNFQANNSSSNPITPMLIMKKLLSSLQLENMLSDYLLSLRALFNTRFIGLHHDDDILTVGQCTDKMFSKTLTVTPTIRLVYHFNTPLTGNKLSEFYTIHELAKMAFINAITHKNLQTLARKDSLTKLDNRHSFDEHLSRMFEQSKRQPELNFGLLMIDLDNFKAINDNYGHSAGDEVLQRFAQCMKNSVRASDLCFRFGGDEFCCLLPGSVPTVNEEISFRIHNAIAKSKTLVKYELNCSIGGAYFRPGDSAKSLFDRADSALYQSKLILGNSVNYA